jgi:3-oxoacyl-[acyl-carrier-protein] synthase II
MTTSSPRVVVTGLGLVTPQGHNVADSWQAILAGQSGFGPVTQFELTDQYRIKGVCAVKEFDPVFYLGTKEARRRDRCQQFTAVAAEQAMKQANLQVTDEQRERYGVFFGTGIGGLQTTLEQQVIVTEKGPRRASPFGITMIMPNGAAGMAAIDYGFQGPSTTITTACAAGADAVGMAYRYLKMGLADVMLTGGTETPISAMTVAGFERAGAISGRSDGTPRPFDKERDGLIPGEGAGVLVLETLDHALARGATILAELCGYGQTTDAFHITAPAEGGVGAARAIRMALAEAGLTPADVDYINAHGTSTVLNDSAETQAIKAALGEEAYRVAISSTKSMTGHIMGGTGAIESVFSVLAIRDQIMPPTINLEEPAEDCDLDYVPNHARPGKVNVVLNNAFGFGGHNAVLVFRNYQP